MTTADMINAARKVGLTQTQIGERSGTSQPAVARFLAGNYQLDSACKKKLDNWLRSWLQIVEFKGHEYIMRGRA